MSETNQTDSQQAGSDEDRILSMLGLDEDTAPAGDSEDAEQPEQGAAPPEGDQPETEDAQAEPPETAPIEPPQFWTKDAKANWDAIPAETKQYIVEREAERDAEVRRSQNAAADARKQAETFAQEVAQERAYLSQHLVPAIQEVSKRLQGDYSPTALAELARTNPAAYVEKVAERDRLMEMRDAMMQEETRTRQLAVQGEMARLVEKVPEWRDQAVARKAMLDMTNLAGEFGYTQQELGAVSDHRAFLVLKQLHDARAELATLKAAKEAPARKAVQPVVTRPPVNATRPRPDTGNRSMSRDQVMRAARSSNQDAQVEALTHILGL